MKNTVPNYTTAQVSIIESFVGTGEGGALTLADATTIAAMPEMAPADGSVRKPRSIVAKINRLGLTYAKKVPARKDGSKVQSKADLVAEISASAGRTFEGLTNAPRADLVALRDVLAA